MEFKDLIKKRRLDLGLTMEELGKKIGVSKATIQRYESGEIKNVRRDKIAKLANALDTTPAYLMGWEDVIADEDKEVVNHFLSLGDKLSDGVEDMTQKELAVKCLLNTCGYDIIKSHGQYHLFGKYSQISAIEKEDVDNLINKAVEVLDLVATKLDYECHEKFIKALNELEKHG